MKKILFLAIGLFLVGCASSNAMPPTVKNWNLYATAPSFGAPIDGLKFYKAQYADTAWTFEGQVSLTNGVSGSVPFDSSYPLHCSTSTLSTNESTYSVIYTNAIPAAPSQPVAH